MNRKGFTIVEMLMVVAILGILVTLVTVASTSVIRKSRERRTEAMQKILTAGFATYYAQYGEWPDDIQKLCDNGPTTAYAKKKNVSYLDDDSAASAIRKLVEVSAAGNPLLDISALFVTTKAKAARKDASGMDFRQAKLSNNTGRRQGDIATSQMVFGYPESAKGHFRRFLVRYNYKTDSVDVVTQSTYVTEAGEAWSGKGRTSVPE